MTRYDGPLNERTWRRTRSGRQREVDSRDRRRKGEGVETEEGEGTETGGERGRDKKGREQRCGVGWWRGARRARKLHYDK